MVFPLVPVTPTTFIEREEAIKHAVNKAGGGDTILIAGKGHEDYQIIGTEKIHFDDREIAEKYLEAKGRR